MLSLEQPRIMGIINVTPDSFYVGSRKQAKEEILKSAGEMLEQGADILDLGAYSSRPGAAEVSEEEEKNRLLPAVEEIRKTFPEAVLSVDTFRSAIARESILAGADMVNDISGGLDDEAMIPLIAELGVPYIIMHKRGTPQNMQQLTDYGDVTLELLHFFKQQIARCRAEGIKDLLIDPGFGFAKNLEQNYQLMKSLREFTLLEVPLLIGVSRKSMIQKVIGKSAGESLNGSTALHMYALMNGASVLRVHDVAEATEVVKLFEAIQGELTLG